MISRRLAWSLLALHVLALLVGTQMPGAWRSGVEHSIHAPVSLASWAHFGVFTSMALLMSVRPLAWPVGQVVLLTLALALLTEGLQFFAIDRHPRWIDVGIDMAGTLLALGSVAVGDQFRRSR
ncbi:MAG: VanZ family protein [Pseudomonadota bacterium]|nr:VanZ family protein [Pseudomonadota bacterium]